MGSASCFWGGGPNTTRKRGGQKNKTESVGGLVEVVVEIEPSNLTRVTNACLFGTGPLIDIRSVSKIFVNSFGNINDIISRQFMMMAE